MRSESFQTAVARFRPGRGLRSVAQRQPLSPRPKPSCNCFTLLELLLVLAITAILMGAVLPVFNNIGRGGGVAGGARMLASQLQLARQYAITKRQRIATVFANGADDKKYVAFRACIVDSDRNFLKWVPESKWEYLPMGAVISAAPATEVKDVDATSGLNFPAIIFKANGALDGGTELTVRVAEGFVESGVLTVRNIANRFDLVVNAYTGKVTM